MGPLLQVKGNPGAPAWTVLWIDNHGPQLRAQDSSLIQAKVSCTQEDSGGPGNLPPHQAPAVIAGAPGPRPVSWPPHCSPAGLLPSPSRTDTVFSAPRGSGPPPTVHCCTSHSERKPGCCLETVNERPVGNTDCPLAPHLLGEESHSSGLHWTLVIVKPHLHLLPVGVAGGLSWACDPPCRSPDPQSTPPRAPTPNPSVQALV